MMPISAVVLAGGASGRMGSDKRWLRVGGQLLMVRTARALAAVADDLMISCASETQLDPAAARALGGRLVLDRWPGAGPLAGIEAALSASHHRHVLVAAVDMPLLSLAVLAALAKRAEGSRCAVVAESDRGPEPLLAAYPADAAGHAGELLARGERRMSAFLQTIGYEGLQRDDWHPLDPGGLSFLNLNAPADLETAARLLASGQRGT